jgi:hypothetical protein
MNRSEFLDLVSAATDGAPGNLDETEPLHGIALHDERRFVTRAGAIASIRWQCLFFNGKWDFEALEETMQLFKRVDLID